MEPHKKFQHLLQPIKDIAANWDIDIARELDEYLQELQTIFSRFDQGLINKLNFVEAAFLIQGTVGIYSKKVDHLYDLSYRVWEHINQKQRESENARDDFDEGDGGKKKKAQPRKAKNEKEEQMTMEPHKKFQHLLQPIKDIAANWDIDIARELDEYLQELQTIFSRFDQGLINKLNFVEAAFLIQGTVGIYSKKVDHLYDLSYRVWEHINQKQRESENARDDFDEGDGGKKKKAQPRKKKGPHIMTFDGDAELAVIDDIMEANNIDMQEESDDEEIDFSFADMSGSIISQSNPESNSYNIDICSIADSGALLIDQNVQFLTISDREMAQQSSQIDKSFNPNFWDNDSQSDAEPLAPMELEEANLTFPDMEHDYPEVIAESQEQEFEFTTPETQNPRRISTINITPHSSADTDLSKENMLMNMSMPDFEPAFEDTPMPPDPKDPWAELDPHDPNNLPPKPYKRGLNTCVVPDCLLKKKKKKKDKKKAKGSIVNRAFFEEFQAFHDKEKKKRRSKMIKEKKKKEEEQKEVEGFEYESMESNSLSDDESAEEETFMNSVPLSFPDEFDSPMDIDIPPPPMPVIESIPEELSEEVDEFLDTVTPLNFEPEEDTFMSEILSDSRNNMELEDYNWSTTYEDLCRKHIEQYYDDSQYFIEESELSKRVHRWNEKIKPILKRQENHKEFQIKEYSQTLIQSFEKTQEYVPFTKIVEKTGQVKSYEVCRQFITMLHMINSGNISIQVPDHGLVTPDHLMCSLKNRVLPSDEFLEAAMGTDLFLDEKPEKTTKKSRKRKRNE
eukprot:TRINITY_DN4159_c0_g1_i1.p1 TRINITY_DN4159_c0_g1~~TRINITY_DN4159_c0_g1_i1.p1  ORF type:complete len:810 (+),score=239.12 TRINITY_DN4159_c0_g1_i1:54-2432(+)